LEAVGIRGPFHRPRYTKEPSMYPPSMNIPAPEFERGPESEEIARLREDATAGNPDACYALGLALQANGPQSAPEALHWFATATMSDHPGGHYQMALHYKALNDQQQASYHIEAAAFQNFEPAVKLV